MIGLNHTYLGVGPAHRDPRGVPETSTQVDRPTRKPQGRCGSIEGSGNLTIAVLTLMRRESATTDSGLKRLVELSRREPRYLDRNHSDMTVEMAIGAFRVGSSRGLRDSVSIEHSRLRVIEFDVEVLVSDVYAALS